MLFIFLHIIAKPPLDIDTKPPLDIDTKPPLTSVPGFRTAATWVAKFIIGFT